MKSCQRFDNSRQLSPRDLARMTNRIVSKLKMYIPACSATAQPPLGPALGQRKLNIKQVCDDFNGKTKIYKKGVPIPTTIEIKADKTYNVVVKPPPSAYFLKQAAGIEKGADKPGKEVAGKVTLKHIYEIAQIKSKVSPHGLNRTCL